MTYLPPALSAEQVQALDAVANWLRNETQTKQVFRLFGYAGTGKTSIARYLAESLDGPVLYAAYTGKATLAMQRAGCDEATTIDSMIYRPVRTEDGSYRTILNRQSEAAHAELIVIDEWSMVDQKRFLDLLSFRRPILALGDPGQLPPMNGSGDPGIDRPDIMLTEIHRQARDNPVLRLATMAREGLEIPLGQYGDSMVQPLDALDHVEPEKAGQLLVGRNETRDGINAHYRKSLGFTTEFPGPGERLVCLRNDHGKGIFNGETFRVLDCAPDPRKPDRLDMTLVSEECPDEPAPLKVAVHKKCFLGGIKGLSRWDLAGTNQFDYAYALTVHKAQGSQWSEVLIVDESFVFPASRHRWLYTAITRASERVKIFQIP